MDLTIKVEWAWTDDHGNLIIGQFQVLPIGRWYPMMHGSIEVKISDKIMHILPIPPAPIREDASGLEG